MKYFYKVSQAAVLSYLFLVVADWFGYSFSLSLKDYFFFVILPLCLLNGVVWSLVNRRVIKASLIRWQTSKAKQLSAVPLPSSDHPALPAGRQPPIAVYRYVGWFIKDILSAFRRYIANIFNLTLLLLMVVYFDIVAINIYSDMITFLIAAYWLLLMVKNRLEGRFSILLALMILPLCPLFNSTGTDLQAEKSGIWVFIFLAIGVFKMIWEENKINRKYRHIDELLPAIRYLERKLRQWVKLRYEVELARENERSSR